MLNLVIDNAPNSKWGKIENGLKIKEYGKLQSLQFLVQHAQTLFNNSIQHLNLIGLDANIFKYFL